MRTFWVSLVMCVTSAMLWAQKFEISGTVTDTETKEKLQSATVFIESVKDSTLITYSITDVNGAFTLKGNTALEKAHFFVSFQGYKEYSKIIDFTASRNVRLGEIALDTDVEYLDGVVVKARKAPITIKTDTLEFNAKSFNTKDDATLEDVMKELPGVKITKEGKITVNGKEVNRILVNGKEFFGNDPQIALKNLPKEIIDKIQVTDAKTDAQKLTGEDSDTNTSEINITIDEDKNKGWFSRLTAGGGTQDRYSASGIVNYFKDDLRVSVLAGTNNINSPGFSFDEIYDAMGNSAYSISRSSNGSFGVNGVNFGGSGNGITSSRSAGLSMADQWGEHTEFTGSYFFGNNDTDSATDSRTTTFLPDNTTFTTSSSRRGNNDGSSHRIATEFKFKVDSLTTIGVKPNLNLSKNNNYSSSNSTSRDANGQLINNVETRNNGTVDNDDKQLNVYLYKRFKKKGNYLSVNVDLDDQERLSTSDFYSETQLASNTTPQIQDQIIENNNDTQRLSGNIRLGQRIDSVWSINLGHRIQYRDQFQDRKVFNRDNTGSTALDAMLSNEFQAKNIENRPTVGVRYSKGKTRINLSTGWINQQLTTENTQLNDPFKRSFNNLYARAFIRSSFGKNTSLYLNYNVGSRIPSIRQLQPVEDRTNPQNIITGNPNLAAQITHRIYLNFNTFDYESETGLFSGLGFNYSDNQVASITTTNADLLRQTTYTNVDGVYDGYFYVGYSKEFKKDNRSIGLEFAVDGNAALNKSFSNAVAFDTRDLSLSPGVVINYDIDDVFDIETEYSVSYNRSRYSLNTIPDQEFVNHRAAIDLRTFWPKKLTLGLRGEYNVYGNVTDEFDNDAFVMIGSLGYKFAKDKAIVKVKAYDIFNQVINTRRRISQDVISDTTNLVLQQYFMLSFTYKFSKFGGRDPNEDD